MTPGLKVKIAPELKAVVERLEMYLHDALSQVDRVDQREAQGHELRETDESVRRSCTALASDCRDAIHRIHIGTYGLCLQCDQPMDEERVRQFPYAALCLNCKRSGTGGSDGNDERPDPRVEAPVPDDLPAAAAQEDAPGGHEQIAGEAAGMDDTPVVETDVVPDIEEGAFIGNGEGSGPAGTSVTSTDAAPSSDPPTSEVPASLAVSSEQQPPPQPQPTEPREVGANKQFADLPIPNITRGGSVDSIAVKDIRPAQRNARRGELTGIEGLAKSIQASSLQQRLVVRKAKDGDGYELIDGHRRFAAVKQLGWTEVPVDLFDLTDVQQLEAMLATAIQRQGLTPLEEAHGFQRMIEEHGLSQRELADRLGIPQSLISKRIALLELPDAAAEMVDSSRITLQGAEELLKLREHPKQLQAAVDRLVEFSKPLPTVPSRKARKKDQVEGAEEPQAAPELRSVEYREVTNVVDGQLREVADAQKLAKIRKKIKDEGLKVISREALHAINYNKRSEIDKKGLYGRLAVDLAEHKKEECHRVRIETGYGAPKAVHYCIDVTRHSKKGKSQLKDTSAHGQRSFTDADREREEFKQRIDAIDEVAQRRREFSIGLLQKKISTSDAMWAMGLAIRLVDYDRLADQESLCEWLRLELDGQGLDEKGLYTADRAIESFLAADPANETKLVFVCALDVLEGLLDKATAIHNGSHRYLWLELTGYLAFLEKKGYTITDVELAEIKRQADERDQALTKTKKGAA